MTLVQPFPLTAMYPVVRVTAALAATGGAPFGHRPHRGRRPANEAAVGSPGG